MFSVNALAINNEICSTFHRNKSYNLSLLWLTNIFSYHRCIFEVSPKYYYWCSRSTVDNLNLLKDGLPGALVTALIIGVHELGHFLVAQNLGVKLGVPYFIPSWQVVNTDLLIPIVRVCLFFINIFLQLTDKY